MGASLGPQDTKSVNVELNIVPFIDLMSCLTAFLLVTAVWVNLSALENEPVGKRMDQGPVDNEPDELAILIESDQMSLASSRTGEAIIIPRGDWTRLESALREFKTVDVKHVEVAAASTDAHPIAYDQLMTAMDTARRAGYPRVGVTDPRGLSR